MSSSPFTAFYCVCECACTWSCVVVRCLLVSLSQRGDGEVVSRRQPIDSEEVWLLPRWAVLSAQLGDGKRRRWCGNKRIIYFGVMVLTKCLGAAGCGALCTTSQLRLHSWSSSSTRPSQWNSEDCDHSERTLIYRDRSWLTGLLGELMKGVLCK